jgi:anti-sigma factor RsiW
MTCHTALTLLDDYADGQLDSSSAGELEEHLEGCTSCRRELAETRRLKELLGQSISPSPGSDYWSQTTRSILARTVGLDYQRETASSRERSKKSAFIRSVITLAASIAVLFSAVYIGENQDRSPATFEVAQAGGPVFLSAAVARQLDPRAPVYTQEDRRRLARGMLLMGPPGIPGRLAIMAEMSELSQGTPNADLTD